MLLISIQKFVFNACLSLTLTLLWATIVTQIHQAKPAMGDSGLDVIIVSDEEKISQSGVIPIGISNHFLTYCTRNSPKTKLIKHNTICSG